MRGFTKPFAIKVCAFVVAAAAVGVTFFVHSLMRERNAQKRAAEKREYLAGFGMAATGYEDFMALPAMLPHSMGPARIGERLYFDGRLAQSQWRTCAACHRLNEGGTNGRVHGSELTRSLMGASFASVFLKDGSLTNMSDVVSEMITRRDRCGGGDLQKVVRALGADEQMLERFRACYPDGLTTANLCNALVEYNRTIMPPRTDFDRYCNGKKDALTPAQIEGMEIFRRHNCLSCHEGPMLGGTKVHEGRKVTALRALGSRSVYLSDGSRTDLGAVLTLMPNGAMESDERAKLVAFLKTL